jgi:hypothetical protein
MYYELIAVSVILAILGGCIALVISATKSAAIAEDDLDEAGQELRHVAGLMEDVKHANQTREKAIADTRAGNIPDRLRAYYRD